jgi:beta-N-acetylhexosaminidase
VSLSRRCATLGCGFALLAAPAHASPIAEPAAQDPLRGLSSVQRAGQLVVLRFNGPKLPEYVWRALRERRTAGVILFRDNIVSPRQLRALTLAIHRASGNRALVMTDQEGGAIRNLRWAPPYRSAPAQRAGGVVGAESRASGRALRAAGVDVTLGPVADVPNVSGSVMAGRAFSRDPRSAGSSVATAVRGFLAGGVLPTAKHFPGLGGARTNTDFGSATVGEVPSTAPWRSAIAAGVPLVMAGHARYPRIAKERIASQSRTILTELLRGRLGFDGVIVTDSMEAKAVRATGSLERSGLRSVRAGADLLLTTGAGSYLRVLRALVAEARSDARLRKRIRGSARRVIALQSRAARLRG